MTLEANTEHPASSDPERAVTERYAAAALRVEASLCCPTTYDPELLRLLPQEVIDKDYGCGDPSRFVRPGETVVDLGSGAGKICYILSQVVGAHGKVVGVDRNDDMLAVAKKYRGEMATRIGWENVDFVKARIQDLSLDLARFEAWLAEHPARDLTSLEATEREAQRLRREEPAIASETVDVIVSNCVLNLVRQDDKARLFREMHRILKKGGRAVISDIVCDETPPQHMQADPDLWSGCLSGAFREDDFLDAFVRAGFYGVEVLERAAAPWQVIEGIEFRSMTVRAFKGKEGPCLERNQAVVYRGPWSMVEDDDGHRFERGVRSAVCDKTFHIMTSREGPYAGHFAAIEAAVEVPLAEAQPFACDGTFVRDPRVTKGLDYRETKLAPDSGACSGPACC